ncbi:MAG: DUF3237 domain-containing protein [Gammaproteobacteria bacterium]|nr:DUF3237 domain-containing protein [Gammaproteobacteria bacterium]
MAELQIPGLELEYAFSVTMQFAERIDFQGPRGGKGYVPPASGEVYGPLLKGRVVPYSGADYAIFNDLSQGIKVNTHYMLESDDGHWIYINNKGYLHRSPDPDNPGQTKLYFRFTPFFESPHGPYEWMSRTMIVGTGERLTNPDRSQFTYYRVL